MLSFTIIMVKYVPTYTKNFYDDQLNYWEQVENKVINWKKEPVGVNPMGDKAGARA